MGLDIPRTPFPKLARAGQRGSHGSSSGDTNRGTPLSPAPFEAPEGDIGIFWSVVDGNVHLEPGNAAGIGVEEEITSCTSFVGKKTQTTSKPPTNSKICRANQAGENVWSKLRL